MADRFEKAARDLSSDFASLRDDLRKLTNVVSDLASDHADTSRGQLQSVYDRAKDRFSDTADRVASQASYAGGRVRGAGAELESRIERNPIAAVMLAVVGGLLIGALSRSRK